MNKVGDGTGLAGFVGSLPDGVGVEPGPAVGDGLGSDGFIGEGVGEGVGVGSDGSIGVGVIFGSIAVGDGIGVSLGSTVGDGVIVGAGVVMDVESFDTVVAMIPEIKNKSVAIASAVFLNILPY